MLPFEQRVQAGAAGVAGRIEIPRIGVPVAARQGQRLPAREHRGGAVPAHQPDVARRQRVAVGPGQQGQQDAPLAGGPVDVEDPCVCAGRAVLQDVAPPGVAGIGGHVVGHDGVE